MVGMLLKKICDVTSLKKGKATILRMDGEQIALYFDGSEVFAFSPFCPHARANLTMGSFHEQEVKCHWHGWRFSLRDGEGVNNDSRLKTYPVKVEDGIVFVELNQQIEEKKPTVNEDPFMPEIKWKK